jgi:hypothetical protein
MTLDQNVANFSFIKSNGLTFKVLSIAPIWESVNKDASPNGVTNYVLSFVTMVYTKGDKEVKVTTNMVTGMKDGKIVEEWDLYDTKQLLELVAQK